LCTLCTISIIIIIIIHVHVTVQSFVIEKMRSHTIDVHWLADGESACQNWTRPV